MDISRNNRQNESVIRWFKNNCIGTVQAATGWGKTTMAIKCILKLLEDNADLKCIVVVPTIVLKSQWEAVLANNQLLPFTSVLVINTAYKNEYLCDLLIIDEAHVCPAEQFRKCLTTIQYKKLLCLTATIERTDGEEKFLLEIAPIIDTVTIEECLSNKWISEYKIYNLSVPFTKEAEAEYIKADKAFKFYAMKCGFGSESFKNATKWLQTGTVYEKGLAIAYYNSMRKRKVCLSGNINKISTTIDILNRFTNRKALVFAENIDFIEKVYSRLDANIGVLIHSKMSKKDQQAALNSFKVHNNRAILSCKSLISGIDLPELDLGIIASSNSSKITSIQSIGRLVRKKADKQAIIINLYTPHGNTYKSQEVSWLNKRQENQQNIHWVSNLNEIT